MPTQVSLLDGALASAGTLAIQTNGTTSAITISSAQVATFVNNPIMTGLTASRAVFTDGSKGLTSNAITGTGNVVMSASPTLTGTIDGAALTLSSSLTLSGGTANGVLYLNGSKVATSGSALTFDGAGVFSVVDSSSPRVSVNGSSTASGYLIFKNTTSNTNVAYVGYDFANSAMPFAVSGSEQMRLTSTGLGIGTSSPAQRLHVTGSSSATTVGTAATIQITSSTGLTFPAGDVYLQAVIDSATPGDRGTALALFTGRQGVGITERARIDSLGNLGLGVTPSPWDSAFKAFQLNTTGAIASTSNRTFVGQNWYDSASGGRHIANGFALRYDQIGANGSHAWYTSTSGTAGNAITFTQAMTLDASGNLLLGTTSPNVSGFNVQKTGTQLGSTNAYINTSIGNGNASYNTLIGYDATLGGGVIAGANALAFHTYNGSAWGERARIDSSGNLLLGVTAQLNSEKQYIYQSANGIGLQINCVNATQTDYCFRIRAARNTTNGTFNAIAYYNDGAGAYKFNVADSGNVTNTNNSYGAISDIKLKENITDATPKLADLMQVKVRNYNLKSDPEHKQLGVIAQELEQVFPGMVEESPDRDADGNDLGTTTKQVKYSVFVPMLIKAMQEQQAIIEQLKARLDAANL